MRFKEVDSALKSILMSEAHTFQCEKGESIYEYVKHVAGVNVCSVQHRHVQRLSGRTRLENSTENQTPIHNPNYIPNCIPNCISV